MSEAVTLILIVFVVSSSIRGLVGIGRRLERKEREARKPVNVEVVGGRLDGQVFPFPPRGRGEKIARVVENGGGSFSTCWINSKAEPAEAFDRPVSEYKVDRKTNRGYLEKEVRP